jgi:predicted lipoprotein with Yx(FWY)xxD motif
MKRILTAVTAIAALGLIVVAAIGAAGSGTSSARTMSSSGSTGYGAAAATRVVKAAAAPMISVRRTSHGKTLVDGHGRSLYLFEADRANMSNCTTSCLTVWPALTSSKATPRAGGGAVAGKIGTIRSQAGRQITYAGHPLYRYVGDHKPGDTNGQGLNQFGAKWYVLAPSGRKIDDD